MQTEITKMSLVELNQAGFFSQRKQLAVRANGDRVFLDFF